MIKLRVVGYVRVSSEDQVDNFSLDAQTRAIEHRTAELGGTLVKIYSDEGVSGRLLNRPGFGEMLMDAKARTFDVLMVYKWDRFSRSRYDSLVVKMILRRDYGIKVLSATEGGQDDLDGSMGLLMEGMSELVAEFYSANLAAETAKGKLEAHRQGYHIGTAPFGYDTVERELVINEPEAAVVQRIFALYGTGNYSAYAIAALLAREGYRSKTGTVFSRELVRGILDNRIYVGEVQHQPVVNSSQHKRTYNRNRAIDWLTGRHTPIVDRAVWDAARAAVEKRTHKRGNATYKPYLLRGLAVCYHCAIEDVPDGELPRSWAAMYHRSTNNGHGDVYACDRKRRGYGACRQRPMPSSQIEGLVLDTLTGRLRPGTDWRQRAIAALAAKTGEHDLLQRLADLKGKAARMDSRHDAGLYDSDTFYPERTAVQQEIDRLARLMVVSDELEHAADVLNNFATHWAACAVDVEAQNRLLRTIIRRVYIKDTVPMIQFTDAYAELIEYQFDAAADFSIQIKTDRAPAGVEILSVITLYYCIGKSA